LAAGCRGGPAATVASGPQEGNLCPGPPRGQLPSIDVRRWMAWIVPESTVLGSILRFPGSGGWPWCWPRPRLRRGWGLPRGVERPATGARKAPGASLTKDERGTSSPTAVSQSIHHSKSRRTCRSSGETAARQIVRRMNRGRGREHQRPTYASPGRAAWLGRSRFGMDAS